MRSAQELPHDSVVLLSADGHRLHVNNAALEACTSLDELYDVINASPSLVGERCYSLLQLLTPVVGAAETSADVSPLQGPDNAPCRSPTSHAEKVTRLRGAMMGRRSRMPALNAVAAEVARYDDYWIRGAPLSALPLSALQPVRSWPLRVASAAPEPPPPQLLRREASLSSTLPFLNSSDAATGPQSSQRAADLAQSLSLSTSLFPYARPPPPSAAVPAVMRLSPAFDPLSPAATPPPAYDSAYWTEVRSEHQASPAPAPLSAAVSAGTAAAAAAEAVERPVVLIALTCKAASPAVRQSLQDSFTGSVVSSYIPNAPPSVLCRPPSYQSMASPTSKLTPHDLPVYASSSGLYGLSANTHPTTSAASFRSLTTPLTYMTNTTATTTTTGGGSSGAGFCVVRGGSPQSMVRNGSSGSLWMVPNFSDTFSPTIAVQAAGDGSNASFGVGGGAAGGGGSTNAALMAAAAAAASSSAAAGETALCVAASRDVFPAHLGSFVKVRCGYGDSRFSRTNRNSGGGSGGAASTASNASNNSPSHRNTNPPVTMDRGRAEPSSPSHTVSNASFHTNTSFTGSTTALLPRRGSGQLTQTCSNASFGLCGYAVMSPATAGPFGSAGTMQPVPGFAKVHHPPSPGAHPPLAGSQEHPQQHPQQQHHHHQQHQQQPRSHLPLYPHASTVAPSAISPSPPPAAGSGAAAAPTLAPSGYTSAPGFSPPYSACVAAPVTQHPLPAQSAAAPSTPPAVSRSAVPPIPKPALSLTIALHIGENASVIRCLLRHYVNYEVEVALRALQRGHPFLRSSAAEAYVYGTEPLSEEEDAGEVEREGGAAFAASGSGDGECRIPRALTDSQAQRQATLYRHYFAYVSRCVGEQGMTLASAISDADRVRCELALPGDGAVAVAAVASSGSLSSAVSCSPAKPSPSGAYTATATDDDYDDDEDEGQEDLSATRAPKTTTPPSVVSHDSAEVKGKRSRATSCSARTARVLSGSSFSYSTSGVYSLTRTLPPQSAVFEEAPVPAAARAELSVPARTATTTTTTSVGAVVPPLPVQTLEVQEWLRLTLLTPEVREELSSPLSFMDNGRRRQLRRLRRGVLRVSARSASEVRMAHLHTLLRGACDDDALAMQGLTYLLSVAKEAAMGEGGGARLAEVLGSASHRAEAAEGPPEQRPTLARAFALLQQRNEETRWFSEIEGAVAARRISAVKLLELVELLEKDPNAFVEMWYSGEDSLRDTLRLTSQYLTRQPRAQ